MFDPSNLRGNQILTTAASVNSEGGGPISVYRSYSITDAILPAELGHKAINLHRLAGLSEEGGFMVPTAFVIGPQLLPAVLADTTGHSPDRLDAEFQRMLESTSLPVGEDWYRAVCLADLDEASRALLRQDYDGLCRDCGSSLVVVRSSFVAEDGPGGTYAGVFETITDISGFDKLCRAVLAVLASTFSPRAIAYIRRSNRVGTDFPKMSVIVQQMVGGDGWQGGVALSPAPDLASEHIIYLSSADQCQDVTSGNTCPEEFFVDKRHLASPLDPVVQATAGTHTPDAHFALGAEEIRHHCSVAAFLERSFGFPLDIEWASGGSPVFILQARPQPVAELPRCSPLAGEASTALLTGNAVGTGRVSGVARIVKSLHDDNHLNSTDVLITARTDNDWDPLVALVAAVITEDGGRGSHVSILARERGMLAIVGADGATQALKEGERITLVCEDGLRGAVYHEGQEPAPIETTTLQQCLELDTPYQAFSRARGESPESVVLLLGQWITRMAPGRVATARQKCFQKGYGSYSAFVAAKLSDGVSLVRAAFPEASLTLRLTPNFDNVISRTILDQALSLQLRRYGSYPPIDAVRVH